MEEAGLPLSGWVAVSKSGRALLESRDELAAWGTALSLGEHTLRQDPDNVIGTELTVKLGWPEEDTGWQLILTGSTLERLWATLPSGLRGWTMQSLEWWSAHGLLGEAYTTLHGFKYARLRPPRVYRPLGGGKALACLLTTHHHQSPEHSPSELHTLQTIAQAELPPGIQRWDDGHMLTLQWVSSLDDPDQLRRELSQRELWLSGLGLQAQRDSSYNEQGDFLDGPISLRPLPPLTFYSEGRKWGFKAVVPTPEGALDEDTTILSEALRAGHIDGHPLLGLSFLVPTREQAVLLLPAAKRFGARTVLYPHTRQGLFWDIDPPGPWLEPATGSSIHP